MLNAIFQTLLCASTAALPALSWIYRFGYSRQAAGVATILAMIGGGIGLSAALYGLSIGSSLRRSFKGALYWIGMKNLPFLVSEWDISKHEPSLADLRPRNSQRITSEQFERVCFPVAKICFFIGFPLATVCGYFIGELEGKLFFERILFSPIFGMLGAFVFGLYGGAIRMLTLPGPHRWELPGAIVFGIAIGGGLSFASGPPLPGGPSEAGFFTIAATVFGTLALGVAMVCTMDRGEEDGEE